MDVRALAAGLMGCLLLSVLLAGCPPGTVVIRDGDGKLREVPVAEAANLAYAEALRDLKADKLAEAEKKFQAILQDFPGQDPIDDTLLALGELATRNQRPEQAAAYYRQIVADYPQSPHYVKAAVGLGMALVKAGRAQEALPTLQSVFDRLPSKQRQAEVAGMLAESYLQARAPVEALRWFTRLYHLTQIAGAPEMIREQVLSLIDHQLTFTQVREALEILEQMDHRGFPLDLLQFKLAKIFYHVHDFIRAQEGLEKFVAAYPNHTLAMSAGVLLKKIIDRNKVNPEAIGVLLPLTGEYREYGRRALEGIQLGAGIFDPAGGNSSRGPLLEIGRAHV